MTPEELQAMKDRQLVNPYMAKIDTRIDTFVLKERMIDEWKRVMNKPPFSSGHYQYMQAKLACETHMLRSADLQEMIEQIRASDGFHIEPEREFHYGPGRYDVSDDRYLAHVLSLAGPDFADDETGTTEWSAHILRFGRTLLCTYDNGAVHAVVYGTEKEAISAFDRGKAKYDKWDDAEYVEEL